jgi:hypothetical protein
MLKPGDRVRIRKPESEYTGCRGSIVDDPSRHGASAAVTPLGYFVTVDGENGVKRPFLAQDLEPIRAAVVRRAVGGMRAVSADEGGR